MLKDINTCMFSPKSDEYSLTLIFFGSYETVGGILAEEVGTFQNIGLKNEGVRVQGYVQITDTDGVSYRIDYQSDSKEVYIPPRGGEAPRTPPALVKLLSLLELHK